MYSTTQNYLYIKKKSLYKQKYKNTLANPSRTMNLNNVSTLQLNSTPSNPATSPTNIMPVLPAPFYEIYTIDPSGTLFGETYPCNQNVWKKYLLHC